MRAARRGGFAPEAGGAGAVQAEVIASRESVGADLGGVGVARVGPGLGGAGFLRAGTGTKRGGAGSGSGAAGLRR